ncbi:SusC/RagA family TonB-linked outer membrane protein [Psychroflexus montanilacus]|uniref:SusC/RagA family TonB-linked outer membrane protein n=1 Tax=Psychroflexus montanilacus TaxID=2873598 RepID=UPI001CCA55B9|nr:TonB-dependent receptor [Psychroflexus montanilacus]MBZ9651913.1 TonB-dependent receptor [Psychroflexus montanilacus]
MKLKINGFLTLLFALMVQISFAQTKTVTGTVTDEGGLPLPGVNILVKGDSSGTQTDFDGNYTLSVESEQTLQFKYLGFRTQEIQVGDQSTIDVSLIQDNEDLDEVVVVAYGNQSRAKVTSSISNVGSESIEQVPIASVDQALQGLAPGVNAKSASGQPGRRGDVIIRGRSSINGATDPLYVIDGTPVDPNTFRSLNNNDIEDISVLKDASAAALYGNRAANGVILVTTKKGSFSEGVTFQYRSLYGTSQYPDPNFRVMNAQQYLTFGRDIFGGGPGVGLTDEEINATARRTNTNWADILLQDGQTVSHELTMTEGSDTHRSYSSMQYYEQEGITNRSNIQRFSIRNNLEVRPSDKFDFNSNITMNYSVNDFVVDADRQSSVFADNTGGELDNPFIVPYIGLPMLNPYNPDGSLNVIGTQASGALNPDGSISPNGANGFTNTPYLALNNQRFDTDQEREFKILAAFNANYHLNDNFTVGARVSGDYNNVENLNIVSPLSTRGLVEPDVNSQLKGSQTEAFNRSFLFNLNPYIRFDKTFDVHTISASVHTEYVYTNIQQAGFQAYGLNPKLPGSGSGFADGTLTEDDGDGGEARFYIPNTFSSEVEDALFSYFGTVDYDYDGKFGLSANLRRDGSSRFSEENRWGTFGSVSGRVNLHELDFLSDAQDITNLKLRASYGVVGNRTVRPGTTGFYVGLDRVSALTGYQGTPGFAPTELVDPNLEWETTTQANIGVDFGFFKNRLSGSLDVYDKKTDNLFFPQPVSFSTGFTTVESNVAEVSNKGIEIGLSFDVIRNDELTWNVFANAAYNKNEVVALAESDFVQQGNTALQVGQPLRSFFLTRWAGVNPANGNPLYLDIDGNLTEQFSDNDRVFSDKQADPLYTGGFGTSAKYKGFDFNLLFSFAAEQYRTNGSLGLLEDVGAAAFSNQSVDMLTAWQQPGDITAIPSINSGSTRLQGTDRYLEDASFLRLRNLSLGYNFSPELLEKTGVFKNVRIYVQGTNLLTFSKWRGFDPESTNTGSFFDYPTPRQYTAGIDITF